MSRAHIRLPAAITICVAGLIAGPASAQIDTVARGLAAQALTPSDGYRRYDVTGANVVCTGNVYVDGRRGNDTNAGTSAAAPKRSIAAAQAMAGATAGARICLARGSAWREQMALSGAGITVADYGPVAEPRPSLRGDDPLPAAFWTLTSGRTNTYQAAITLPGTPQNKQWVNAWDNGAVLTFVADAATVESTPGSYTVTNQTNASGAVTGTSSTLYIHPADNSSPITNGRLYEYTRRSFGLVSTAANTSVIGIETRRSGGHDGSIVLYGLGSNIYDVVAREGSKHNALVAGGTVARSQFLDIYYGTNAVDLIVFYAGSNAAGVDWTIRDSILALPAYPAATVNAIYSHTDGSAAYGTGRVTGNTITNVTNAVNGTVGGPANIVVEGNIFSRVGLGLRWTPSASAIVRNNSGLMAPAGGGALVEIPSATSATFLIDNNRINFVDPGSFINLYPPSGAPAVTITNNIFYISGVTRSAGGLGVQVTRGTLAFSGNVFDAAQTIYAPLISANVASMTASNNISTAHSNTPAVTIGGVAVNMTGGYFTAMQAFQPGLEAGSGSGTKGFSAGRVM